jgi:hypothetical protein
MEEQEFSGVETILARMKTHPEEFFETQSNGRWRFIFKDYFRDAMNETEKGRIHDALKKIRRMEFDATVLKELMREEVENEEKENTSRRAKAKV